MRSQSKLILVLLLASPAFGQGLFYQFQPALPNATVSVCAVPPNGNPCSNPVSVFSDQALTQSVTQPLHFGPDGNFGFWVAAGQYQIQVAKPYNLSFLISLGGGGTSLNGCSTNTAGNLQCTNSVAVTSGTEGTLTLSYSGLPAPPSTAVAQFAADAAGVLNYSPGSNASFAKVYVANASSGLFEITNVNTANTGTGFATVFPPRAEFPNCASLGWNTSVSPAAAQCGDNFISSQPLSNYTVQLTDENSVLLNTFAGVVSEILPIPTGTFAAPFVFWVDTNCQSTIVLTATSGSLINGVGSIQVNACGWSRIWADTNGVDWHAQSYTPAGGVVTIQ